MELQLIYSCNILKMEKWAITAVMIFCKCQHQSLMMVKASDLSWRVSRLYTWNLKSVHGAETLLREDECFQFNPLFFSVAGQDINTFLQHALVCEQLTSLGTTRSYSVIHLFKIKYIQINKHRWFYRKTQRWWCCVCRHLSFQSLDADCVRTGCFFLECNRSGMS